MRWERKGLIWKPDPALSWSQSHATCPTPILIDKKNLRIFLQTRDKNNVGRVVFIDVNPAKPWEILQVSKCPVLDVGRKGFFDDNGVFQTCVVKIDEETLYMYYVGFEICKNIRYRLLTGAAISKDSGISFTRLEETPILERSTSEPYIRGGPFVLFDEGIFKMWYVAGDSWEEIGGKSMPIYDLRYIESKDGINWPREGRVILRVDDRSEHGFGRPFVTKHEDGYRLLYSVRKRNPAQYRMGYALSKDGLNWTRKDEEWDLGVLQVEGENESVEFGAEFSFEGKTWLFYNGNNFGEKGVLLAEKVKDAI